MRKKRVVLTFTRLSEKITVLTVIAQREREREREAEIERERFWIFNVPSTAHAVLLDLWLV